MCVFVLNHKIVGRNLANDIVQVISAHMFFKKEQCAVFQQTKL